MTADITFARERLSDDLWSELMPLLHANHDESIAAPGVPPLDVDRARFDVLDRGGALRLYTARHGRILVGYAAFVVLASLLYRGVTLATHVGVYLRPEHRGAAALRLVLWCDRALAADGVTICRQSAKPESPFGALLDAVGYHVAEIAHEKHLRIDA